MPSALTRARRVNDNPVDLDKHRGMAAQKATDMRRALADVASDELGISPTQALSHPAVARALSLVGAPSYEQSLAELIARPVPPMLCHRESIAPSSSYLFHRLGRCLSLACLG